MSINIIHIIFRLLFHLVITHICMAIMNEWQNYYCTNRELYLSVLYGVFSLHFKLIDLFLFFLPFSGHTSFIIFFLVGNLCWKSKSPRNLVMCDYNLATMDPIGNFGWSKIQEFSTKVSFAYFSNVCSGVLV